ncbi:MAG: TonB-dependent receptor [Bacteroidota bacterium]
MKKLINALSVAVLVGSSYLTQAQTQEEDDLFALSLEELMDISIVSASKTSESIFDAPLSSSVVTKEEISQSGVTSIPEALRLVPGVIVRQQSNGNYDVHLRGFDNIPPGGLFPASANSVTLVMIDGRVVYNYFGGGTFWETLPIDLNDVERIEVVRGASSAMYGPNAAAGVIHIITKNFEEAGVVAEANAQGGSYQTLIANTNLGYTFNSGLSTVVTANFQQRDRQTTDYYDFFSQQYVESPADITSAALGTPLRNPDVQYPNPSLATDKYGVNAYVKYHTDDLEVDVTAGYQDSEVQKVYVDTEATPFTTNGTTSTYGDARLKYKGWSGQLSYLNGEQSTFGVPSFSFDFNTLDAAVEYEFTPFQRFTVRPGLNYRSATYDGIFIGGEQSITTISGSLYSNYQVTPKWRIVAAGRVDKYDTPDKAVLSYEIASTYRISENFMVRGVTSRANRAPYMLDNFLLLIAPVSPTFRVEFLGNQNMDLLTMTMYEFGFRYKPVQQLMLDVELFQVTSENYSGIVRLGTTLEEGVNVQRSQFQNIPIAAQQTGASFSLNWVASEKVQLKWFGTLQATQLSDHIDSLDAEGNPVLVDLDHQATPTFYGGLQFNYQPISKLNINLTSFYYGDQAFSNVRGDTDIDGKILFNAKVGYQVTDFLNVFVNTRNLLGDDAREFAFADPVGRSIFGGLSIKF